jgi:magnesium-transporting ATPase (P-type)
MDQMQPQPQHEDHEQHTHRDLTRRSPVRVIAYFIVLIVLNILLAVYTLYMLGMALAFDWSILRSGTLQVILESALQLLLFFSPVILTIILNRLLYRAFRGRGRFPRGIWFFAMLVVVVVQAATIAFIFGYGYVEGVNGLSFEQIVVAPLE